MKIVSSFVSMNIILLERITKNRRAALDCPSVGLKGTKYQFEIGNIVLDLCSYYNHVRLVSLILFILARKGKNKLHYCLYILFHFQLFKANK